MWALTLYFAPAAWAEGLTGSDEVLFQDTDLLVDVIDDTEIILWIGPMRADVYDPDDIFIGTLQSDEWIGAEGGPGTYTVVPRGELEDWWQIWVLSDGFDEKTGRLHSYSWHVDNTGSDVGWWVDFYVVVPLGDGAAEQLFVANLSGIQGDDLQLVANGIGVTDQHARSVALGAGEVAADYPMYVAEPTHLTSTTAAKPPLTISSPGFTGEGLCPDAIVPGETVGTFSLDTSLYGVLQVTCDADDGSTPEYDRSGYTDRILLAETPSGTAALAWDGTDAGGAAMSAGGYRCLLEYLQGSAHLLVGDADVAYEGVRLMSDGGSGFGPSTLMWNDALLQSGDESMPYGLGTPLVSSGPEGVSSRRWADTFVANEHTHTWGDLKGPSKGSEAWMDTWTWSERATSGALSVEIIDPEASSDADTLRDADERCVLGTDHTAADTDGDGLWDDEEVGDVDAPLNTDGDGLIDALDNDDDNDGILTAAEVKDSAVYGEDIDGDGTPAWQDEDSDGDGIPDAEEPDDADGSGVPDYLEPDTDTDTGAPSLLSGQGYLGGGACTCGSGSAGEMGGVWGLFAGLLAWRRRR